MRHEDARLKDHDGPYFPTSLDRLRELLDKGSYNNHWLKRVAAKIDGCVDNSQMNPNPRTSDDYAWFSVMSFRRGYGVVTLLIPWSQDWIKKDGTQADRSIAVYSQQLDSYYKVSDVVDEFIRAVEQQQELDAIEEATRRANQPERDPEPEAVDLNPLLVIAIDDEVMDKGFMHVEAGRLNASITPRDEWPEAEGMPTTATIWVFETPIEAYTDLEEHLERLKGDRVTLGDLPTLVASGDFVELDMKQSVYYDVFCIAFHEDDTGFIAGGGRYGTINDDSQVPPFLTFEETKAFALAGIGLSLERGKTVRATVTPMTAWGSHGRFIIAGFEFGRSNEKDPLSNMGVMVQHNGHSNFYHGATAEEMREFLKV